MNRLKWLFLVFWLVSTGSILSAQTSQTACACCKEEYNQLDFWVGDWVVYSKGRTVGFNKISKIESNCILRENWKSSVSSHTGTSYTFYDMKSKEWKHIWMDSDGQSLILSGSLVNGQMVMSSEEYRDEKGNRIIDRMTWIKRDDGTVRQLWERSEDGGLDWSIMFDGLYRKRKAPEPTP